MTAPVRTAFFGLGHTNLSADLDQMVGFINVANYAKLIGVVKSSLMDLKLLAAESGRTTRGKIMKKIICERCHEEYIEGEIFPSNYFPYILCVPCEKEYEHKLWKFRIEFINNQPERSKREDYDYWEAEEYDGERPWHFKVFANENDAKKWVNIKPNIRKCRKLIIDAVL